MTSSAKKRRREECELVEGKWVYLERKGILNPTQIKKLDSIYIGPYHIAEMTGEHNYRLKLLFCFKRAHKNFHIRLLRRVEDGRAPESWYRAEEEYT
jgi:hypothetical protein